MAGLGSMCVIFLFVNLVINIIMLTQKLTQFYNYMAIAALVLCLLTWIFLTAGWGHYADKKGGISPGSVDYGASFAFTIIVWLGLFPYSFFWFLLWNQVASEGPD